MLEVRLRPGWSWLLAMTAFYAAWTQSGPPVTAEARLEPNGHTVLTVSNHGDSGLTAYAYRRGTAPGEEWTIWDVYVDFNNRYGRPAPIPSGSSSTKQYADKMTPGESVPVPIAAGVFANGSSFGNPAALTCILERRKALVAAIDAIIRDMKREMDEGMKKGQIQSDLRKSMSRELANTADADLFNYVQFLYQQTIRGVDQTLRDSPMPSLPYTILRRQISTLSERRAAILAETPLAAVPARPHQ